MTIPQQKKPWLIAGGVFLAILLFVVWFARSPVSTLDAIKDAALNNNVTELESLIDFMELRSSIKLMVSTAPGDGTEKPTSGNRLAHMLVGALTAPIVDALVTPQSLVFLLNGQMPNNQASTEEKSPAKISANWHGLSVVDLEIQPDDNRKGGLTLVMRRDGLAWRLVGIKRTAG